MRQLIQTGCPGLLRIFVYALPLLAGCGNKENIATENYQLNDPLSMQMGKVLNEISDIFYVSEDSSLVAISDNQEKIIKIRLRDRKLADITKKVVSPGSDLEGVVMVKNIYYILLSRGLIKAVLPGATDSSQVINYELPIPGPNDFESIYHDPEQNALVLICKSCAHEDGKQFRTAFKFDLATKQFDTTHFFTISELAVQDKLKDKKAFFAPSAAALHPVNGNLYILSSASSLLVVTDKKGEVLEVYQLNPDKYPQAEGIAFAPNGNMFISNEGKLGVATLLFFPYRSPKK